MNNNGCWWWSSVFLSLSPSSSTIGGNLSSRTKPVTTTFVLLSTASYAIIEIGFYAYYRFYSAPKANELTEPHPYPGIYSKNRVALLERIYDRAERICRESNRCLLEYMTEYFMLLVRTDDDSYDNNAAKSSSSSTASVIKEAITAFKEKKMRKKVIRSVDFRNSNSKVVYHQALPSPNTYFRWDSSDSTIDSVDSDCSTLTTVSMDNTITSYGNADISSSSGSDDDSSDNDNFVHPIVNKNDVYEVLSSGLFSKHYKDLNDWEYEQLLQMHNMSEERFGITFREEDEEDTEMQENNNSNNSTNSKVMKKSLRKISLDNIDTLHRPLIYYLSMKLCKFISTNILLRILGFRKYVSSTTGLICWHRPPKKTILESKTSCASSEHDFLPTLFFHGIAPGGLPLYLPILLLGLVYEKERPLFLFETPYISSTTINFSTKNNILSKEDTINGIYEILNLFDYTKSSSFCDNDDGSNTGTQKTTITNIEKPLAVIGHSFGTFTSTWLIHHDSILRNRIKQLTLLDPVSILLSEPYVMKNFDNPSFLFYVLGTSELYVNHYIRRQFSWYNSELWLDEIPNDCYTVIGLSHHDKIVNSPKVLQEILTYAKANATTSNRNSRNDKGKHHYQQKQGQLCMKNNNCKNTTNVVAAANTLDEFYKRTKVFYWENEYARHGYCLMNPSIWKEIKKVMTEQESQIISSKRSF